MTQPPALDQMLAFFAVVQDPRRQHPTTLHAMETILTITMLATIWGVSGRRAESGVKAFSFLYS